MRNSGWLALDPTGKFLSFYIDGSTTISLVEMPSGKLLGTLEGGAKSLGPGAKYWSRDGDKPMVSEKRAPVKFVASMPRHLIERLASLTAKFKGKTALSSASCTDE